MRGGRGEGAEGLSKPFKIVASRGAMRLYFVSTPLPLTSPLNPQPSTCLAAPPRVRYLGARVVGAAESGGVLLPLAVRFSV